MSTANFSRFRPALERLEAREVFAGNVQAVLSGGNLTLTGDDLGNGVLMYEVTPNSGHYRLEGLNQAGGMTRINGQTSLEFKRVFGDLTFELHGGDDRLVLGGGHAMTCAMRTSVETGFGDDTVDIAGAQLAKLSIGVGSGNDLVRITNSTIRYAADITAAAGDDNIQLDQVTIGYGLELKAGAGQDHVSLQNTSVGYNLNLFGGDGDDVIELTSVQSRQDINVSSEDGADTVKLDAIAADNIYANLGLESDNLTVTRSRARNAHFVGDSGFDRLTLGSDNQFHSTKIESIERR